MADVYDNAQGSSTRKMIPDTPGFWITQSGKVVGPPMERNQGPTQVEHPTPIHGSGKNKRRLAVFKTNDGTWRTRDLAELMAELFLGSKSKPGHADGNPLNCHLTNLVVKKNGRPKKEAANADAG